MSLLLLFQNVGADRTFTGSWTQAPATWAATVTVPVPTGGTGGKFGPVRLRQAIRRPAEPIVVAEALVFTAAFVQEPASWRAEMDTYDPDLLFLLFDEPALIGAR